jgi:hypothetical protein
MAVVKYDVSNVESGGGGEQPQPALYQGKIASLTPRDKKANGEVVGDLEVVVDIGEEYSRLWTYVKTPNDPNYNEAAHGWKLRELTDALKLPAKGSMDTAKQIGKAVNVKVVADTNLEGEYRGRIKNLFAPGKIEEDGENLPEGGGDDEPLTAEELAEWSVEDIKEEMKERGLSVGRGRFNRDKAIEVILENQGGDEAEADGDGSPGAAGLDLDPELLEDLRTDPKFYDDWADDDIKAYVEDLGIAGNVGGGRKTRAKYVAAIVSLAESAANVVNGAGADSGEDEGETDDYDEWDLQELKDEVATRNEQDADIKIAGRQTKDKLVAALREDDKVAEPF